MSECEQACYVVASFPGLRGGEKSAWYTLHAPGDPRKSGVIVYYTNSLLLRHLYTFSGYYLVYWDRYVIIDPPANGPGNEASYIAELAGPS